jgi:hypothetical protein
VPKPKRPHTRSVPWKPSKATLEERKRRDDHTKQVCKALERWDVGAECSHGHLPADPPTCSCWDGGVRLALWSGLCVWPSVGSE